MLARRPANGDEGGREVAPPNAGQDEAVRNHRRAPRLTTAASSSSFDPKCQ